MPSHRTARSKDGRRGAGVIEFALVFMIFMMMVAGVFEVGRTIWAYNTLAHAAKQGARYAMVHGAKNPLTAGDKTVDQVVKEQAIGLDPATITVAVSYNPDNQPGSMVTVTADHTLGFVIAPLVGVGNSLALRGASTKTIMN